MSISKFIIAAALAAPAMGAFSAPAFAQPGGIATAEPAMAVWRSKAYAEAAKQIDTTYRPDLEKMRTMRTDRQKALSQLDKNGDKNVDQGELDAARDAKNPAFVQYEQLEAQITQLTVPMTRAEAFAIEMILKRYREAQDAVVKAKKINVILAPESFVYAPEGTDVTEAITTELDRVLPAVPITAPDNWRPTEETVAVLQRVSQYNSYAAQAAAQRAAQGAQGAPAAGQPAAAPPAAAGAKKPPQNGSR